MRRIKTDGSRRSAWVGQTGKIAATWVHGYAMAETWGVPAPVKRCRVRAGATAVLSFDVSRKAFKSACERLLAARGVK